MNNKNINDVVMSSRVRLARNIAGLPFGGKIDAKAARAIPHDIYSALSKDETLRLYRVGEISATDGAVLMEKHLISADLLSNKESGAVLINESETLSIMINEEDHIREQCILAGESLKKAYETINRIDDRLLKSLRFAFNETLGFLTACPTNLGTGLRASAMMFLPGLSIYNKLESCINAVSRFNMAVRGVYGEGSKSAGYIFQISNQKTLGITEDEIIGSVSGAVAQIAENEFMARDMLLSNSGAELKDKIFRAYGILTNAYKLSSSEFMELISLIKLGAYYGFISVSDRERFDRLITAAQPANIIAMSSKELSDEERDVFRAAFVSRNLVSLTKK